MSLRGCLVVLAVILGLLFYFHKPQEWWASMTRAAMEVNSVPADSVP